MSATSEKKADLIFEKWTIELRNKDRSMANVSKNFDELFNQLFEAGIEFDVVHPMVEIVAKRHYPQDRIARRTYDDLERKTGITYKEFMDTWCKEIKDKAFESFYAFFSNDVQTTEEKKFGSMSVKEYRLQRKYAESFPEITFEELQDRMRKIEIDLTKNLDLPEDDDGSHSGG